MLRRLSATSPYLHFRRFTVSVSSPLGHFSLQSSASPTTLFIYSVIDHSFFATLTVISVLEFGHCFSNNTSLLHLPLHLYPLLSKIFSAILKRCFLMLPVLVHAHFFNFIFINVRALKFGNISQSVGFSSFDLLLTIAS